jgi:hypothetical protein
MKITVVKMPDIVQEHFSLNDLNGKRYFVVTKVEQLDQRIFLIDCDETADLREPDADPMIIGTVSKLHRGAVDYQIMVIWRNQVWRTLDDETGEVFCLLTGLTPENVRKFAEKASIMKTNDEIDWFTQSDSK